MAILAFPPIETADEYGLLAVGGDLEVESLLLAYRQGIFPWPPNAKQLAWFSPPQRAVLFLKNFHISRSLRRTLNSKRYHCTVNQDFQGVISGCAKAKNRKGQRGTWITSDMIEAYCELHGAGYAHSVECYLDEKLVGGVYGVSIGGMFSAESMYYTEPDASKVALHFLVGFLRERGVQWLDAQVMNPFLEKLGFEDIAREEYLRLLTQAVQMPSIMKVNIA